MIDRLTQPIANALVGVLFAVEQPIADAFVRIRLAIDAHLCAFANETSDEADQ